MPSAKQKMYQKHAELMKNHAEGYFDVPQQDVVNLVPLEAKRILEVGCAAGATLYALKRRNVEQGNTCEVVGVDITEEAVIKARERLDAIVLMDAEEDEFIGYPHGYFDVIIINYVLEHVVNPWAFLRHWMQFLRQDGYVIIGVPNIAYYKVLRRIIFQDDFAHEPIGIMDWTHLRYFTRNSLERILAVSGLEVDAAHEPVLTGKKGFLSRCFPWTRRFFMTTYIVRARKLKDVGQDDYIPFEEAYSLDSWSLPGNSGNPNASIEPAK